MPAKKITLDKKGSPWKASQRRAGEEGCGRVLAPRERRDMEGGESTREGHTRSRFLLSEGFEGPLTWGAFQGHTVHIFGQPSFSDTVKAMGLLNKDEYLPSQGMYGHSFYIPSDYYSY